MWVRPRSVSMSQIENDKRAYVKHIIFYCVWGYMFRSLCDHHQAFLRIKSRVGIPTSSQHLLTWFVRRPDNGSVRTETCSLTHNKIWCVWRKLFYHFTIKQSKIPTRIKLKMLTVEMKLFRIVEKNTRMDEIRNEFPNNDLKFKAC